MCNIGFATELEYAEVRGARKPNTLKASANAM